MSESWDRLYTPHRLEYLRGQRTGDKECPFCVAPSDRDRSDSLDLVCARGSLAYVVLNLFPYNAGHLLVCPYRHVADYTEVTEQERTEIGVLTQTAMTVLRDVSGAQGFNIGMNQGSVSGTGIAGHLHQHIVPRWGGDTNFMPIIGGTKVLPELLEKTRDLLAAAWPSLGE